MDAFLSAGGGFLVAVIWMDLMFDSLALRARAGELPEDSLAQIAGYYRRVTTTASPMNLLISAVMAAMVGVLIYEIVRVPEAATVASILLALCGVPIVLALTLVFPAAIRLGSRVDPPVVQSSLARRIAVAHVGCLAAMLAFVAVRIAV
jgi:hypothetical protein